MRKPIKFKLPIGEFVLLYSVGELAKSLGKQTQTIQKLEWKGVLPKTPFRNKRGNRLYTQEQMDLIVKYVCKCDRTVYKRYPKNIIDKMKEDHETLLCSYGIRGGGETSA